MTTTRVESLPAIWDDVRDVPFFRTTDRLFSAGFCFGASVLLASYDDDSSLDHVGTPVAERRPWDVTPASPDSHDQPGRHRLPVQVRRTG